MFIFVRCLRSSAAVTPVKYEHDIIQVSIVLIIVKNWENNGTEKIGLETPTSELLEASMSLKYVFCIKTHKISRNRKVWAIADCTPVIFCGDFDEEDQWINIKQLMANYWKKSSPGSALCEDIFSEMITLIFILA